VLEVILVIYGSNAATDTGVSVVIFKLEDVSIAFIKRVIPQNCEIKASPRRPPLLMELHIAQCLFADHGQCEKK